MAKKKRRKVTIKANNVRNDGVREEIMNAPTEPEEVTPAEPVYPLVESNVTDDMKVVRATNYRSFYLNAKDMDSIHSFCKKAEVITDVLSNFYNFKLDKHQEMLQVLNVDLFNIFEFFEISIPEYPIYGKKYRATDPESGEIKVYQQVAPNIFVMFMSGTGTNRNDGLIITVIDIRYKDDERNNYQNIFVGELVKLFASIFPGSAIYSDTVEYDREHEDMYYVIDFITRKNEIMNVLTSTTDEFLNVNGSTVTDMTQTYMKFMKEHPELDGNSGKVTADTYLRFINIFNERDISLYEEAGIEYSSRTVTKFIFNSKLYVAVPLMNGEEPISLIFPVDVDIDVEGEDDSNDEYYEDDEYDEEVNDKDAVEPAVNAETTVKTGDTVQTIPGVNPMMGMMAGMMGMMNGNPNTVRRTNADGEEIDLPTMSPEALNDR